MISEGFWSEWGDLNTQPRHPKCRALPVEPHPDIQFLPLYHGREENQRFLCLWSFLWSKPLLCCFRQSGKILQTQVSQGFAAFRLTLSRIQPRHSQTRRDTSFAIPGYSAFAIIPRRGEKSKAFSRCGHLCAQYILDKWKKLWGISVSYTHLTLPTKRIV